MNGIRFDHLSAWKAVALVATVLAMMTMPLSADVRVIVGFDAQGPQLVSAMNVSATLPKLVGQRPAEKETVNNIELVRISWFDAAGQFLGSERVADPRIAHYPGGRDESSGSRVGGRVALFSGALLLRGPDRAQRVEIALPASRVPLLAAASWSFDLSLAEELPASR